LPAGEHGPTPRFLGGRRDVRASLVLGLAFLAVSNANGRSIGAGDTYPTRYLPFAIWRDHTLALDPIAPLVAQGQGSDAFWMRTAPNGRTISLYPVVQAVLVAPVYLPAIRYLGARDWQDWRVDHVARVMEKLVASLVAALSASGLYLVLRRRAEPPTARLLTIAYAFGSTTWMISSQALWQHGMAQLLIVGTLLVVTAPCTTPRAVAAGLLCGLVAGNRPPDAILAAALGAFALYWAGRRWPWLVLSSSVPVALVLLYNLRVAGHYGGGYGLAGDSRYFEHDALAGLFGLLFSPTRGLFVFSPFLLFLALAWRHPPAERGAPLVLTWAVGIGTALQLLLYSMTDWRAGISWGPRYLTDMLPLLVWLLVPVAAALRGVGRALFHGAVGVAIVIEASGAFCYTGRSDLPVLAVTRGPDRMRAAWDWRNAPFVASVREGRAPAELATVTAGRFDAVELYRRPATVVDVGHEVVLSGWALAGEASPYEVSVGVHGRPSVGTRRFVERPDVRAAFGAESPSGWLIPWSTKGLRPGEYVLTAYVWASERGERRYLGQRMLTVRATPATVDDLDAAYETAAARLREHQQAPGYWLTAHTTATRFAEPQPEMNTYLTALLVDLLDPLAASSGLADGVARARAHLTSQIEASGLVRYHGRPDGPGIGSLGCVITPDSDDTSLVWRIAPPRDRGRLTDALATLERYRTDEGLYRTWLAPRDAYQCLDPGRDPNPADLTIQMHVLQMLARERPKAARALCESLHAVADQDKVWVYYAKAPLVPMLRARDLDRAGCTVTLPESRTRTTVPGQAVWVAVVRLLAGPYDQGSPDAAEARRVLRDLARDDFALLRENPPLLYHNDLSATVPRYYWSADVGYALWLRLAHEHARIGR
jgi:hypothetical protein